MWYDGTEATQFRLAPNVVERISPGAFTDVIQSRADVVALFNHNLDHVLGRRSSGTLELEQDGRGLRYRITPPEYGIGAQVLESVRRGDIIGSSFGFVAGEERVVRDGPVDVRQIDSVEYLRDVGPVTIPAYSGTSVANRSLSASEYLLQFFRFRSPNNGR